MPVNGSNPPNWMGDLDPAKLMRVNEMINSLIDEGYSEEQAYEIALERTQEWEESDEEERDGLPPEI